MFVPNAMYAPVINPTVAKRRVAEAYPNKKRNETPGGSFFLNLKARISCGKQAVKTIRLPTSRRIDIQFIFYTYKEKREDYGVVVTLRNGNGASDPQ